MIFDKSSLSPELAEKQKMKGTFDSSCLSICDYDEAGFCQTCQMNVAEKRVWKVSDQTQKADIIKLVLARQEKIAKK